jgi:hypothetical protein
MNIPDHPHVIQMGDMTRCTACHRQWSSNDVPPECVVPIEDLPPRDRLRQTKRRDWMGPGDHGKTTVRTRPTLRR